MCGGVLVGSQWKFSGNLVECGIRGQWESVRSCANLRGRARDTPKEEYLESRQSYRRQITLDEGWPRLAGYGGRRGRGAVENMLGLGHPPGAG